MAVLRLAYMTGAQIVQAPPWPGASFTEEQPEPGAGIRTALALGRAAWASVRGFIQRGREAGEALGVAELPQAHRSSLGEAAFEYAAQRPAHLGEFRWTCQEYGETMGRSVPERAEPGRAAAVSAWLAEADWPPRAQRITPKTATSHSYYRQPLTLPTASICPAHTCFS